MNTETDKIIRIASRARKFAKQCKAQAPSVMDLAMSLSICHAHRALRLGQLEQFDDGNLGHDVFGIHRHVNRMTGELMDCFVPRCGFETSELASR